MTPSLHPATFPRRTLAIAASVVAVIVASVVLAPPLHALLPFPFHVVFKRLLTLGTLAVLVVFVRVRRETLERCGLTWRDGSGTPLVVGFVVGATGLTLLLAATLASGHASLVPRDFTSMKWVTVTAGAVLTGVLVGPIEEFVFRGLLFTWARDRVFRGGVPSALLATSVAYALLHFIDVRRPAIGTDPGVIDGLRLMAAPFRAFGDVGTLWPAGVGLFLFGLVLNALVVRTGALHASMGLHAGCVAVLRLVPYLMTFASDGVRWWGTKKVYDGVAGWVAILLIGVILAMLLRPRSHERRSQVRR